MTQDNMSEKMQQKQQLTNRQYLIRWYLVLEWTIKKKIESH